MSILDGLKSIGKGIASIPGKLNEARYSHASTLVPIGKDPFTGEDITIPEEELMQGMYDPASGQIMKQQQVRTGPSKFGNFLSQGLPRMLDAGIAAATSRGNGQDSGILAGLRGMDIGRDRLQKRDAFAYHQQRQMQQDAAIEAERRSRAEKNRAQTALYERRLNEQPTATGPKAASTWEGELVQRWRDSDNLEEKNAIADQLNQLKGGKRPGALHNVGGALYDEENGQWLTPPKTVAPKPHLQKGTFWKDLGDGFEEEHATIFDPNENKTYSQMVEGTRRKKIVEAQTPGRRGPQRIPTQQDALTAKNSADDFMRQASQNHDKAIELARSANAPLAVQGLLLDAKKKAAPPAVKGTTKAATGVNLGGPAWKRTKAFGGN